MLKVDEEDILNIDDKEFPVQWVTVDNLRLIHFFEEIGRAIYCHEQKKNFHGNCRIVSRIFIHPDAKNWSKLNLRSTKLIEKEQPYWVTEIKGDNTDIFTYQFSPIDGFKCQTLSLTFYKATKIYVIFMGMSQEEIGKIRPKFAFITKLIFGDLER